jgi:hypothetical protein
VSDLLPVEPGVKVQRRRQGLAPYLRSIEDAVAAGAGPDDPAVDGPPELREIVSHALAVLQKSATDIARLRREEPRAGTEFFAIQAELMLDSALGTALEREMQGAVNSLVAAGAVQDARNLSKLQGRLRSCIRELKLSIAESNRGRDEDLVEHFTDVAARESHELPSFDEPVDPPPPATSRRQADRSAETAAPPPRRRRVHTEILLGLVIAGSAFWLLGRAFPGARGGRVAAVSRNDFPASAPIERVVARPPSAYVVVDAKAWDAFDEGQRRRLVDSMAATLARNGYWGLSVRTPEGQPAAQWLLGRGTILLHRAATLEADAERASEAFDRFVP